MLNIKKKKQKSDKPIIVELSEEQVKRQQLTLATEEIKVICEKYDCELGIWFNRDSVERLSKTFEQLPGIQMFKMDVQIRMD